MASKRGHARQVHAQRCAQLTPAALVELRAFGFSDEGVIDLLHAVAIFGWANQLMHNLGEPEPAQG